MHGIDTAIQQYISAHRGQSLTEYFYILTLFFNISIQSFLVMICIAVLAYLRRGKQYAYLFVTAMGMGALFSYLLKIYFNVARPTDALVSAIAPSFPSYHATVSTVFFIMVMYIFSNSLRPVFRILLGLFCLAGIALVGYSRLYLGIHWFSDILGGVALGIIVSLISIYIFKAYNYKLKFP